MFLSGQAYAGFNLGDTIDSVQEKIDEIVLPIKDFLAQPVTRPLNDAIGLPDIVNSDDYEFDLNQISIPSRYNPDLGQLVMESGIFSYLSLLPEILGEAIPLSYDETLEFQEFNGQELWFVFFYDGEHATDIEIKSEFKLNYDVLNQEGSSIPLNEFGGLDSSLDAGFYYIRVMNVAKYAEDIFYPAPKSALVDPGFTVGIETGKTLGTMISGTVRDACTDEPVSRAGVEFDGDYIFSHRDGNFKIFSETPVDTPVYAFAEGYENGHTWIKGLERNIPQADFLLFPLGGCGSVDEHDETRNSTERFRIFPVYDDVNGVVHFMDVKAIGLPGGEKHFRVQLSRENETEFLFQVTELLEIETQNQTVTALYDYNDASLSIPELLAFGKKFFIKMEHDENYVFSVLEVAELQ